MAYSYKYSSEYNYKNSYKYRARVGIEVTTNNATTYAVKWIIEVQALYGYLYGMAVTGSGECSGTAKGYTTSSPHSWTTVRSVSGTKNYTKTTSKQTKNFYAKAYGTTVDGIGSAGGSGVTATYTVTVPALASYTITFNKNGGTGGPTTQTKYYGKSLTLSTSRPTKDGYNFSSWNTTATGSGTNYSPGGTYPASANAAATLYAKWTEKTFTVTYNANGGTGAPSADTKYYTRNLSLSTTVPIRENYKFLGWGTSNNTKTIAYSPGDTYPNQQSITLYAIWEYDAYNIAYNTTENGGSGDIALQTARVGTQLTLNNGTGVTAPTNYFIESWNTAANGTGVRYELGQTYTGLVASETPLVLYAQYKEQYVKPSVRLLGSRIDSYGENSAGGERVKLTYTWSAARDAQQYFNGTFALQYTNGDTDESGEVIWNDLTGSNYNFPIGPGAAKGNSGNGEFIFDETTTKNYLNNNYSFRISISDTSSGETDEPIYSTTYIIPAIETGEGVEKDVVIIPGSFKASRIAEFQNPLRVSFQWTPYYNGNDNYTSEVIFPLKIESINENSAIVKTAIININKNNWSYNSSTKTYTTTIIINNENYPSDYSYLEPAYILKFYINSVSSTLEKGGQTYSKDTLFQDSQERSVILASGYPVHINANGTGIALFGLATDLNGFKVDKPSLLNNTLEVTGITNLKNELSVSGNTNLISSLTVNGVTTLNNGLIVNNSTNLNGSLIVNDSTNLNGVLTVNNQSNFNNEVNVAGRVVATGDVIANKGILEYNLDRLTINLYDVDTVLNISDSYKNIPLRHYSGSNSWLTPYGDGVKINGSCYVMVWGYFYVIGCNDNDAIYISITKNGTNNYNTYFRIPGGNNTIPFLPMWVSCNKDDVLRVQIRNASGSRGRLEARTTFTRVNFKVVGVK